MTTLAWHFSGDKLRDGSDVPPVGEWLTHDGELRMCHSGFHASRHPLDALRYAPGRLLHRVECDGAVTEDNDKLVCSKRRIVASRDAGRLLQRFAKDQALTVVHLWDAPQIVVEYLQGDDDAVNAVNAVNAARDAAWDVAWSAANAAGNTADAAWSAVWSAANAAGNAADAAWSAANAAGNAAWDAANAARNTADAAWSAAWSAAWDAARNDFVSRVDALFLTDVI